VGVKARFAEQTTMRIFIAQTLDGFIAGEDDSLDHLVPFQQNDYGYDAMLAEVGAVVVGRRTFDRIYPAYGWTYPPHLPGIVLTRRPLPRDVPAQVVGLDDPVRIAARWPEAFVDGGAQAIAEFLWLGAVRRATIFTLPVRIGRGVRLFPQGSPFTTKWEMVESRTFPCGTVSNEYRVPQSASARPIGTPPGSRT
jgi:dihydrofolate reductase